MSISLFIIANSYYLIKEPGYYRSKEKKLQSKITKEVNQNNKYKCITNIKLDSTKYLQFLSEKLNNNKITGELIYNEFFAINYDLNLCNNSSNDCNYTIKILDIILCKFTFLGQKQRSFLIDYK